MMGGVVGVGEGWAESSTQQPQASSPTKIFPLTKMTLTVL